MALKMNVSFKNIPSYVKVILSVIPALIIALVIIFLFLIPKQKEIKQS